LIPAEWAQVNAADVDNLGRRTAYRVVQAGCVEPLAWDGALATLPEDGPLWVQLVLPDQAALEAMLDELQVPAIVREHCRLEEGATRVIGLPQVVFVSLSVMVDAEPDKCVQLNLLSLPGRLVTLHRTAIGNLERGLRVLREPGVLPVCSATAVLVAILLGQSSLALRTAGQLRRSADDFAARMDAGGAVPLSEILALKRQVLALDGLDDEQHQCVSYLLALRPNSALDLAGLQSYLELTLSNSRWLQRRTDRLAQQVGDLQQRYAMRVEERTNQRLAMLTVISALFLPPTLIAGICGMNFERLPGFHAEHGFEVTLGVMILSALVTLGLLRRYGWFGDRSD
jgi:magnesium transporter